MFFRTSVSYFRFKTQQKCSSAPGTFQDVFFPAQSKAELLSVERQEVVPIQTGARGQRIESKTSMWRGREAATIQGPGAPAGGHFFCGVIGGGAFSDVRSDAELVQNQIFVMMIAKNQK